MPGVERLVAHLAKHKIPMCVATGSTRAAFELKTRNHTELFAHFSLIRRILFIKKAHLLPVTDHVVTGDDARVAHGKPAPDLFLVALGDFGPSVEPLQAKAQRTLVFEDAPNGVMVYSLIFSLLICTSLHILTLCLFNDRLHTLLECSQ